MENNNTILVHIGTMSMDFHPCPTIDQQADCEASNDESNAVAGKEVCSRASSAWVRQNYHSSVNGLKKMLPAIIGKFLIIDWT